MQAISLAVLVVKSLFNLKVFLASDAVTKAWAVSAWIASHKTPFPSKL